MHQQNTELLFRCPVCKGPLYRGEWVYSCDRGHTYDISTKGHVNLLLANQKNSKMPGDDPACLAARRKFLANGFYQGLSDKINGLALELTEMKPALADCCCGEGYYIKRLYQACVAAGKRPDCVAFDISKQGVKMAASRNSPIRFAAASVFSIPLLDHSVDLALHCFAPYCSSEIYRILKPGGWLLGVIPGKRHLFSMKEALYRTPYENDEKGYPEQKLVLRERVRVEGKILLQGSEKIYDLFAMTPYFYRTAPEDAKKLLSLPQLETELDFIIQVFQKKK